MASFQPGIPDPASRKDKKAYWLTCIWAWQPHKKGLHSTTLSGQRSKDLGMQQDTTRERERQRDRSGMPIFLLPPDITVQQPKQALNLNNGCRPRRDKENPDQPPPPPSTER